MKSELASPRFRNECTSAYIKSIEDFIQINVIDKVTTCRDQHGMFDAAEKSEEWDDDTDLSLGAPGSFAFPFISDINLIYPFFRVRKEDRGQRDQSDQGSTSYFLRYLLVEIRQG